MPVSGESDLKYNFDGAVSRISFKSNLNIVIFTEYKDISSDQIFRSN